MTGAELAAEIAEAIAQDSRLDAIREKIEAGTADLKDSEQYTAICAEITGRMMRGAVARLDDREESFTEIARERYRETFDIYSTVQAIIDRALGIRIAAKEPGFQEDRARKIGHALEDQTVPESTILRRAESASENFVMSQHDRCVEENAKFRDRAGLQSYAVRTGGAKCCQWCADVSGKYPADSTPDGFWGRHDNCKCSILYESRRGTQLLGGTSKKWEVVAEGAGAEQLVRLTHKQAMQIQQEKQLHRMAPGEVVNNPLNILTNGDIYATIVAGTIAEKFKSYVPPREQRIAIIKRGIECEKPIFDTGALASNYRYVDKLPDYYDVVMHGCSDAVLFFDTLIDYQTLGAIIMGRDDYKRGTKIRLISCETGKGTECVAEYLSKMLGVEVLAPTEKVTLTLPIKNKSRMIVESDKHLHDGEWKPFGRKERS